MPKWGIFIINTYLFGNAKKNSFNNQQYASQYFSSVFLRRKSIRPHAAFEANTFQISDLSTYIHTRKVDDFFSVKLLNLTWYTIYYILWFADEAHKLNSFGSVKPFVDCCRLHVVCQRMYVHDTAPKRLHQTSSGLRRLEPNQFKTSTSQKCIFILFVMCILSK